MGEGWSIQLNGTKTMTDPSTAIHVHALGKPFRAYLQEKGLLSLQDYAKVNWAAVGDAMASSPALFCLWAAKHTSRWCGVGYRMLKWK